MLTFPSTSSNCMDLKLVSSVTSAAFLEDACDLVENRLLSIAPAPPSVVTSSAALSPFMFSPDFSISDTSISIMAYWQEDSGSSIELSDSDLEEAGFGRQVL